MKITFLGTGHGLHEKGRYRTSMMIEVGESVYLIDAGSPVMHQLINNDRALKEIRAVFITHTHNDHLMNVLEMVDAISCTTTGASIDFYIPEKNAIEAIKNYLMVTSGILNEKDARMKYYDGSFIYEDENIKLIPFETGHLKKKGRPSYGYILEAEGKRVIFSGDLSYLLEMDDFPRAAKELESELFICEMAHFDFEFLRPHIKECKTKRIAFNHIKFPVERIPLLEKENESGEFAFPLFAPSDYDVIEI
jgi:ribonuclease BN (tRNA processing enzyme)